MSGTRSSSDGLHTELLATSDGAYSAMGDDEHKVEVERRPSIDEARYLQTGHEGLTEYEVGRWQGSYGTQTNLRTGAERLVRRGRTLVPSASTPADLEDEACALCQESFAATPECGTRWRPAALRCI